MSSSTGLRSQCGRVQAIAPRRSAAGRTARVTRRPRRGVLAAAAATAAAATSRGVAARCAERTTPVGVWWWCGDGARGAAQPLDCVGERPADGYPRARVFRGARGRAWVRPVARGSRDGARRERAGGVGVAVVGQGCVAVGRRRRRRRRVSIGAAPPPARGLPASVARGRRGARDGLGGARVRGRAVAEHDAVERVRGARAVRVGGARVARRGGSGGGGGDEPEAAEERAGERGGGGALWCAM